MNSLAIVILLIVFVIAGIVYYRKKLSAQATLERILKESRDSVDTDEKIYSTMLTCIAMNGNEFNSFEEIEEDLKQKENTLKSLEEKGFGDEIYKNLNETEKKIYLILNGYDLELFPEYLTTKAINIVGKSS